MRKKLIILIILLIGILGFVGYKSYLIHNYKIQDLNLKKSSDLTINLEKHESNQTILNLSFYISPTNYQYDNIDTYKKIDTNLPTTESTENQVKETDTTNNQESSSIKISTVINLVQNTCRQDQRLGLVEYQKLVNKENEIDLIKKYLEYKDKKLSIFSSSKEIKLKYLTYKILKNINIEGNISFLKGLNGICIKNNTTTNVLLFNNNNLYKIIFTNIDDSQIEQILSTINFQ